jgi:hypothetical protein
MCFGLQDTVVVVPPYPYSIMEDHHDVPLENCWYAQTQLFFTCHLCPIGGQLPKNGLFKISPDDLLYHLEFFNPFEELMLLPKGLCQLSCVGWQEWQQCV